MSTSPPARFVAAAAAHEAGQLETAAAHYARYLDDYPRDARTWCLLGALYVQLGRHQQALAAAGRAAALQAGDPLPLALEATALRALGRLDEACSCLERALAIAPGFAPAAADLGATLLDLDRPEPALAAFDQALSLDQRVAASWVGRGHALLALGRAERAVDSYSRAIELEPRLADAYYDRGLAERARGRLQDALADYQRALALRPDFDDAANNGALLLQELGDHAGCIAMLERLAARTADYPMLTGNLLYSKLHLADWRGHAEAVAALEAASLAGRAVAPPFVLVLASDSPAAQKHSAEAFAAQRFGRLPRAAVRPPGPGRVHVGYVSSDFYDHATANLMAGLIEAHDRRLFEITGISFGPDDRSPMRLRLEGAFDRFIDVRDLGDEEVSRRCRELGLDVAVDLKGYTHGARTGIFARRIAPLQVQWLGFPGTMGADFIDYLVADAATVPDGAAQDYREQVIRLPDCYQPNDRRRPLPTVVAPRSHWGLRDDAVVYCCFNHVGKISPPIFDAWMRILAATPSSQLWLLASGAAAKQLASEAGKRGIDPDRLVFAPALPLERHLSRYLSADLFLDTFPCGAHTTASDALWMALPLLTCSGRTFASRVAASLLGAADVAELVTTDLASYERLAIALGRDPARLAALRRRLDAGRLECPAFDTDRFRRNFEAALLTAVDRARGGEPPIAFDVADAPRQPTTASR